MAKGIDSTVEEMRDGTEITFAELLKVCEHFFGTGRVTGSHHIFKTPWIGNPRINIQNEGGKAKRYQVKQVLEAIDKLRDQILAQKKAEEKAKEKTDKPKKK